MTKRGTGGASASGSRRRKKDTTDETVETRKPGDAQSELKMPAPDRQLHYFDALKNEREVLAKVNQRIRTLEKTAAAENVDMKAIKNTLAMEKGDVVKYRKTLEQQAVLMRAKGLPVQMSIHDIAFENAADQAKFEARAAAKAGRSMECRWPEGSKEHEAYVKEYMTIQASHVPGVNDENIDEVTAAATGDLPLSGADVSTRMAPEGSVSAITH